MIAGMTGEAELTARFAAAVAGRMGSPDDLALGHWGKEDWGTFFAHAEIVSLAPGDMLLAREEAGSELFFLAEGELEVAKPQRESQTLTPTVTIVAGSVVGEIAFFDGGPRSASVWASTPSRVFRMTRAGFEAFRDAHPRHAADLAVAIARILAGRLRRAQAPAPQEKAGWGWFGRP